MNADLELDTRGLNCPLPILKAKKALADMPSGSVLKIISSDPGSLRDFKMFTRQSGHELLDQQTLGTQEIVHWIRHR
jgi:TusA-related sulfurtransferase